MRQTHAMHNERDFQREGTVRNQERAAAGTLRTMVSFALIPSDRS